MDTSLFSEDLELIIGLLMKAQDEYAERMGDDSLYLSDRIADAIAVLQAKIDKNPPIDFGEPQQGRISIFGTDQNGRILYHLEQ